MTDNHRGVCEATTERRYELMAMAKRLDDVISLGRGDPDLPSPPHVVETAKEALCRGRFLPVAPPEGLFELRRAVAAKLRRENGINANPEDEILITTGGQEAFFLLVQAIVNPGDQVLMTDPRYTSYDAAIRCAGGEIVAVPTTAEDHFRLRPEALEEHITPRTKVLVLISPGNPTAAVPHPTDIREMAEMARRHRLFVISDEIYERYTFGGARHLSMASLPGMRKQVATLNSVSKAYAMTGWRVGYVAAPAPVIAAMREIKRTASRASSVLSQWAAQAALDGPQDCIAQFRRTYAERRKVLIGGLEEMGMSCSESGGGLFVFPDMSGLGMTSSELALLLLREAHVLVLPGEAFGTQGRHHLRVSFLAPKERLAEALSRMRRTLSRHRIV
jgi:aminotransferase